MYIPYMKSASKLFNRFDTIIKLLRNKENQSQNLEPIEKKNTRQV